MQLLPVSSLEFDTVYDALEEAFPREERRDRQAARLLLTTSAYSLLHVVEEGERRGCVGLWELPGFTFIEHLLTYPAYRNMGLGARVLGALAEGGRPLVLEAEPPISPLAVRRLSFYARCGFHRDPLAYLQPPYREEDEPTPLVLLSYPAPLADARAVAATLYREVYGIAEPSRLWESAR